MNIYGRRLVQLILIAAIVSIVAAAALQYSMNTRQITPVARSALTSVPERMIATNFMPHSSGPLLPEDVREQVLSIVENSNEVKMLLKGKTYRVNSVLPWMDEEGHLIGGCAVVSFPEPVWLEFNSTHTTGEPIDYIGWVWQLTVCVDTREGRVAAIVPSLNTRNVPSRIPATASQRARLLAERALEAAERFLAEHYGLKPDEVELRLYGILNGVAAVTAAPKSGGGHGYAEVFVKINVTNGEVVEALKMPRD